MALLADITEADPKNSDSIAFDHAVTLEDRKRMIQEVNELFGL